MENKRTLTLRIDFLKKDIQYIIDKMNTYDPSEFSEELKLMNIEKINKQKQLDEYIYKLKELVKDENKEKLINSNIAKLYKGKNTNETIEKVNKAKELREKAKNEYIEFSKYELEYNKYDSRKIPGYIFLYQQIIDTYGICPYIRIEIPFFDLFSLDNKFYVLDYTLDDELLITSDILDNKISKNNYISHDNIYSAIDLYNNFIENGKNPVLYEHVTKTLIEFTTFIIDNNVKKKKLLEPDNVKNIVKSTNLLLRAIVETNRHNWLLSREDKGLLYYQIRDKIVFNKDYNDSLLLQTQTENDLKNFIYKVLNDQQKQLLEDSILFIENEYINCTIKSKKIKERFKILIKALTLLFSETKIPIHEYLTIKYNLQLFVQSDVSELYPDFRILLSTYKQHIENTEQKRIYSHNMNRNLHDELCLFLTNKKEFFSTAKTDIVQAGKYFRRWIALTQDEKNERFESFADYYIEKYMIRENLLKPLDKADLVEKLSKLLIYSYSKKHMIYRDFKWTTKKGIIENVKVIRYNKSSNNFELTKIITNIDEDGNIKDKKCKKRSSSVSIFNSHERIVNEEILIFIVKYIQANETKLDSKLDNNIIEDCVNLVKTKMKLNKLQKDDKLLLSHKLQEMYSIIRLSKLNDNNIKNL